MSKPGNISYMPWIKRPPLPEILYKYRDIGNPNHLQTLTEQTIFLSSAYRFNDPFDCKIPLGYQSVADDEELQRKFARKIGQMWNALLSMKE
jgi:hypothetical protein